MPSATCGATTESGARMVVLVHTSRLTQALKQLPAPLLRALDRWSEGLARRKSQERQRAWEAQAAVRRRVDAVK